MNCTRKLKMMKAWYLFLLIVMLTGLHFKSYHVNPVPQRPNILFCVADDWSGDHASIYGDKTVITPTFDRMAKEGVLFKRAFCASPSCSPSRAAILTGQYPHRLEEGGNLWGSLSMRYPNYAQLLEAQGYLVGMSRKGWGPGNDTIGGYKHNPAGQRYSNFEEFYAKKSPNQPFCYWFGSTDPHRPYERGTGEKSGLKIETVQVPACFPDVPEIRQDILDYYFEVQRFDKEISEIISFLEQKGDLDNTIVVITSDNGMPFPRAKANLYDLGTKMPLVISWKSRIKGGRLVNEMVNLIDLAPTFLEAASVKVPQEMSGKSLLSLLEGKRKENLEKVQFLERERHAYVRPNNLGYPSRGVRTNQFLYIANFQPDRYPAGNPEFVYVVGEYGDCDNSPTKSYMIENKNKPEVAKLYALAFEKRPEEELYDLEKDPAQLYNVAENPAYSKELDKLRKMLRKWQKQTHDPRYINPHDTRWDNFPYYGGGGKVD